ncbi:MAG: membrane protein insertase YidC [Acidobacteriota bacterium]|nr:membrane protein insertase YidC [Acidobacteriota bacterium]
MEKRLVLFLLLSAVIFFGYAYVSTKLYPPQKVEQKQDASPSVSPVATFTPPAIQAPVKAAQSSIPSTQAEVRQIRVKTDHWIATLSNQGGVLTDWTMTNFPDGKPIDQPTGVNLVSLQLSQQIGAPFRFYIPSDNALEKTLNSAAFEIKEASEQEIRLNKGEKKEITFFYANNGIEAIKTLTFKGLGHDNATGFDFDFQAGVKRNGTPVEVYIVIGPNFGDQNVKEISTYKHPPQLTYADSGGVERKTADSLKLPATPTSAPVSWAAVDDNYFAMAIAPPRAVPAIELVNDNKVSIAVLLIPGEPNHIYAGPKDLRILGQVSTLFGLNKGDGSPLEDIVNYGILNYFRKLVKPIAQFMLWALRAINNFTHNFGWSIVVLTVLLNMVFFPLRWKSSVMMKRAAAMQPKMKELQEKMKKLDKSDPRMLDLQKEQMSLMKEGNPLLGCLPLLLQMPFFVAVYAILTVSIEVRHAPFFGWLTDLSAKDPLHVLPIVMCVTMIAQTALTPSPATADPTQKRIQYLMPPILTFFFFWSAPAGLVLYWMMGNLVGVMQQFIINRLPPTPPPPDDSTKGKPSQQISKGKRLRQAVANP